MALTVVGLLLLVRPTDTGRGLAQLLGVILIALAGVDLVVSVSRGIARTARRLVLGRGVVTAAIGTALVVLTDVSLTVVAILVGMQLAVGGGVSILLGYWSRAEVAAWKGLVGRGIVALAAGGLLIAWPGKSVDVVAILLGLQWLIGGFASTAMAVVVATPSRRS